jgi:hypothetical protein
MVVVKIEFTTRVGQWDERKRRGDDQVTLQSSLSLSLSLSNPPLSQEV